ncbi:MAG: ATP-binding protein [Alphaproteobacteria bacterium]
MRLLPRTLAGRIGLTLVAGVVLVLAVTAGLSLGGAFGDPPRRGPWQAQQRIANAILVVAGLPPELRTSGARALDRPWLRVRWTEGSPPVMLPDEGVVPGWLDGRPEERLRAALEPIEPRRITILRAPDAPPESRRLDPRRAEPGAREGRRGDGRRGRPPAPPGEGLLVRVELDDGYIDVRARLEGGRPANDGLVRFGLMVAALTFGLGLLALLIARWVTASLARFAAAADRLGGEVNAPSLPEEGPEEIRRAAQAFNRMQRRIRRFVDERLYAMAAASHDLRTPITRLRLRAEFVDDDEQRTKMLRDLDEMEAILSSTIAFVREQADDEPRVRLDLTDLVAEVCEGVRDAGHAVTLDLPPRMEMEGRTVALRRAFANLIGNAVKYGGATTVHGRVDSDRLVVDVEDYGPGIPDSELEKVFAPFYRLESSRSRETGGTGLGLTVAQTIMRAHGGEIELANRPKGGLRQTVTLPRTWRQV